MFNLTKKIRAREAKKRLKIIAKTVPMYKDEFIAYGAMMLDKAGMYKTMEAEDYIDFMYSMSDEIFVGNFMAYVTNQLLWENLYKLYKHKVNFLEFLAFFGIDEDDLESYWHYMGICENYK